MSVTCKYTLNSIALYPALPIDIEEQAKGEEWEELSGNERFAYRKTLKQWTLRRKGVDETVVAQWRSASPLNTSYTLVDEAGTSYTVRTIARVIPLTRTIPAVPDGTSTTGPGYYDVEITARQVQ